MIPGTFRVVPDEFTQFSLDEDFEEDDNDLAIVLKPSGHHSVRAKASSNQPLIPTSTANQNTSNGKSEVSRNSVRGSDKELSRYGNLSRKFSISRTVLSAQAIHDCCSFEQCLQFLSRHDRWWHLIDLLLATTRAHEWLCTV